MSKAYTLAINLDVEVMADAESEAEDKFEDLFISVTINGEEVPMKATLHDTYLNALDI